MSRGSVDVRDTGATTATALSLDSKTESRLKTDSRTKSDSKGKVESASKTTSASKTVDATSIDDANRDESGESGGKIDLKGKLQLSSKSKSDSKSKSVPESKSKSVPESKSKSVPESNSKSVPESKSKSDSKSKLDQESKPKSDQDSKSKSDHESKSKSDQESKSKSDQESKSKSDLESKPKSDSKSKSDQESKSKSDSKSKSKSDQEYKSKSDSKSRTDSKSKTDIDSKSKSDANTKSDPANLDSQPPVGSKSASRSRSKSKTESGSKGGTKSSSKVETDSPSKATSESAKLRQRVGSRSKTESISKPDSLVNRLESGSAVESSNNVVVGRNQTRSKSKSESDGKAENNKSTDSGEEEPESANNSPAAKPDEPKPEQTPSSDSKGSKKGKKKKATGETQSSATSEGTKSPAEKKNKAVEGENPVTFLDDNTNPNILPTKNNPLYNTTAVLERLDKHPLLKMRRDGKYYLKIKDTIVEEHPKVKRNKRGDVIPTIKKELLGHIERVVSRFCEDVLCISRAQFLPLSSQGERHLVWVGKKKANHIIKYLNGNGCYVVNRFPGDIFVKDKQVMGIILRDHMLMRSNHCYWKCGVPKEDILNPKKENEDEEENPITYRICRHMVNTMKTDEEGCEDKGCYNFEKHTCKHMDIFVPEVQSFCTYNALQDFSNRLEDDLKGQTFVCKPAYLYKGFGFRFFKTSAEFQEFYHMTEGKETSRHDFMVQRLVDKPYLFQDKKVDVRAFLLVVVLRYRRVVSFIHYGFCRVSVAEFEAKDEENDEEAEAPEAEVPLSDKEKEKKLVENYEKNMRMLVCTYRPPEEKKDRIKRLETGQFYDAEEDRSQELKTVFESDDDLNQVKEQIRHIGIRVSQAIENKVWDSFGCFQIFGLDLCVDEDMKVWLLEINSHAMSQVDTLSPTQRKVVPAVIMEALGLVVETTYKSFHYMRLRKSPTNEFEETGFLFRQNYDFIFSTLAKKRMDYVWPKPPKWPNPPFFERIGVVDEQIKMVDRRKKACLAMKIAVREEQLALKKKRMAKDEEES